MLMADANMTLHNAWRLRASALPGMLTCQVACAGAWEQDAVGADGGRGHDAAQRVAPARVCAAPPVPLRAGAHRLVRPLLQGCGALLAAPVMLGPVSLKRGLRPWFHRYRQ